MEATTDHAATGRRNRSIRSAVVMSILSKLGTFGLQLLAIPVAIRVLGRAEFGLYASVSLTLSIISLFEVGVGPALAHGLAKATATGDRERLRVLASTSFFIMVGIALLVAAVMATVLVLVPVNQLYGEAFADRESVLRPALWIGLGMLMLLFLLNLTERIREGFLEVATTNVFGAVGNVIAAMVVAVGIHYQPHVWFLVLAVHGSVVLTKLCNTGLLWAKRPEMIPAPRWFSRDVARHLLGDGLAFSTCCLLTGIVEYNLCGWYIGLHGGPAAIGLYGVLINVTVMMTGFVLMVSTPTWPAVAEALARNDPGWARRAARKLTLYGGSFALCASVGLTLFGPFVFRLWLGKDFADLSHGLFACYGFYFLAHIWRHLNHTMMIGTGQVKRLVKIQLAESALVAVIAWLGLHFFSIEVMLLGMGSVLFLMTGRILPAMVSEVLDES